MLDLSVIVVSWNTRELLVRCLRSVRERVDLRKMEVIVVDNGSTDGSLETVEECFPEVKLIKNRANLGFARANNIGIRQSGGKYVALLNSDVKVLDGCFRQLSGCLDKHPRIGIVGPKILGADGRVQRSYTAFPTLWNSLGAALALHALLPGPVLPARSLPAGSAPDPVPRVDVLSGCFWMVRREALENAGLLDESFFMYGEDVDWCRRFWQAGWQVAFCPDAVAVHHGGASSSNAPVRFYVEMYRSKLLYFRKHHGRIAQLCLLAILWTHQAARIAGYFYVYALRPARRAQAAFKIKRSAACLRWLLRTPASP